MTGVGVLVLTVSRDFVLGNGLGPAPEELQAALEPRFSVVREGRSRTVRRTWLDTFDWRLHQAGLTLELVTGRGHGQLVLRVAGGESFSEPVNGVRWPALATALPPGPVRARLAEVTRERALLPAVRVVSSVASLRACNADDKTVAWLTVDSSAAAPSRAQLPPRLTVAPVRGYQAQADRIVTMLAQVSGVEPVRAPQLDAALAAVGRHPGDYTGKIDVPLTDGMPGGLAVASLLLRLLGTLEANVAGAVRDTDTEFLHDLRVAVRRTRTGLKLAGAALPEGLAAEFAPGFKWLGDATTPTRDLDVYLLDYPEMAASLTSATPAELAPFHDYLVARREQERRRLVRALHSRQFQALTTTWRDALTGATAPRHGAPSNGGTSKVGTSKVGSSKRGTSNGGTSKGGTSKGGTAAKLASAVIRKAHRRVLALGGSITDESPSERLHDLRKRCKELRYALEFFASLCDPPGYQQAVRELKGLQDVLGRFQDCQVQQHEIRRIAAEMTAAGQAPVTTLLAMGDLSAQIGRAERRARREFAARFGQFASDASRRRFGALTAGGLP
jgi:CHAD domain-containing protein